MKRLSKRQREEAIKLHELASETQTAFWTALRLLEDVLGCDVDETHDMNDYDIDTIREASKEPA
jgi:hypothetical protein